MKLSMNLKACDPKDSILDKEGKMLDKCFNGTYYESFYSIKSKNGYVEEYKTGEHCYNSLLNVPGTSLMSTGVQGTAYFFFLIYLFLGISINADIFIESIEVITSTTKDVAVRDNEGNVFTM